MAPSSRFKMNLSNNSVTHINSTAQINSTINRGAHSTKMVMPVGLNYPMITRVSSARPSCGACGK
jgi:hypothetical protein